MEIGEALAGRLARVSSLPLHPILVLARDGGGARGKRCRAGCADGHAYQLQALLASPERLPDQIGIT
jgi:hypothetical protein